MTNADPESRFRLCEQRKAILTGHGHMLVTGGPGSGKTTIALLKARRRVLDGLKPHQKVLFLSFSNSAIRRIAESAGRVLDDDIAVHIDIKTYHSFAWEIISSHGYLISSKRRLQIVPKQDAAVRKAGLTMEEWLDEQNRLFLEDGLVTYDQFAPRAGELLRRSAAIRHCFCDTYPLILVDEFQDTDEDQWVLVQILSQESEIVALGDSEQRVYEWRPRVSATRLQEFARTLDCRQFDFANENNRSPTTGIAGFARSLLSPGAGQSLPEEISICRAKPWALATQLHLRLRMAYREARRRSGIEQPKIAVAARSKLLVRRISDALAKDVTVNGQRLKALAHDVLMDEHQIVLAARVVANVLSGVPIDRQSRLAGALDRVADFFRATGAKTNIQKSDTLRKWARKCGSGDPPSTKCVTALNGVLDRVDTEGFVGVPDQDWRKVRRLLQEADAEELKRVAELARYLRVLRRGSAIEQSLIGLWVSQGSYEGAEVAVEQAILQTQIIEAHRELATITVMNMHQLKGREYDAILLVEDKRYTFMARDQTPPHSETRRLIHMALTRARHYAAILTHEGRSTLDCLGVLP